MNMETRISLGLIFAVILGAVFWLSSITTAAEDVVIITNRDTPASSLSESDVRNIFLGKKTKWDNGQKIVIVTLKDSETHKNFLKKYIAKTATQFKSYWKKQVFTGKGSFPKSFEKEEDLVDFVAGTEGAIGYVSSGSKTDAVKTITTN